MVVAKYSKIPASLLPIINNSSNNNKSTTKTNNTIQLFAGFIFVCSNDTLPDLKRRIFGLPAHHAESVRAIRKGMPLFLFNYSSRCLCGVFEAASDGGFNIDPHAWENTDQTRARKSPVSRYPAQVKVRLRFQRPPLDEETFRPLLEHFEGRKFRLELTDYQVQQLLKLFRVPVTEFFGEKVRVYSNPIGDPDSPFSAFKSDSDCYSECSSKGTYTGEDECGAEEAFSEDRVLTDNKQLCFGRFDDNNHFSSESLNRMVLNVENLNQAEIPEESLNMMVYGAVQIPDSDKSFEPNKSHMLCLNVNGPAVSSVSVDSIHNVSHCPVGIYNNAYMVPPQIQPTFCETMIYIPIHPSREFVGQPSHVMHKKVSRIEESKQFSGSCISTKQRTDDVSDEKKRHFPPEPVRVFSPFIVSPNLHFISSQQPLMDHIEEPERIQTSHVPTILMPSISRIVPMIDFELLHFQILQFARLTRPSFETLVYVESAIDSIRSCVKKLWPNADVEVFGSFATGLCLQHSDIDIAIVDAPFLPTMVNMSMSHASSFLLRELGSYVKPLEWCESYNVVAMASVPVLKCQYQPIANSHLADSSQRVQSISIDITIGGMMGTTYKWNQSHRIGGRGNQHTGGAAREYVLEKIQELPALAPLVFLLKSFLHHKGLSNVYLGGLGSFSLTLLVTFFLEHVDFHAIPCLSSKDLEMDNLKSGLNYKCELGEYSIRRAAKTTESILALWESSSSHCLGNLLVEFLKMFAYEDLSSQNFFLKGLDGHPGGKCRRRNRHIPLWIDDPLRPGVNVGAGSFGVCHVQDSFREMLQVLSYGQFPVTHLDFSKMGCQDSPVFGQLHQLKPIASSLS